jgi:hypothetical protein
MIPRSAPVEPSVAKLNFDALAGDDDALRALADKVDCETITEFLMRFVPKERTVELFDRYADQWHYARQRRVGAQLAGTNLNQGWNA